MTSGRTADVATNSSAAAHTLHGRGLRVGYDGVEVIGNLDVEVPAGRISVIIGANGCGKSTLLRTLARLLRPEAGQVLLDARDMHRMSPGQVARVLGMLPQGPVAPEGITVADLVGRGRYPRQGLFRRWSTADDEAVHRALSATDMLDFADRPIDRLSGGQRQRVWIAMTLAQETDILLLDEPTTFLDLAHQIEILDLLNDLNHDHGNTVVLVLHDLNQAARFGDHLIAMKDGRIVSEGPPEQVITVELISAVFGIAAQVVPDPVSGTPLVVPHSRRTGPGHQPAVRR